MKPVVYAGALLLATGLFAGRASETHAAEKAVAIATPPSVVQDLKAKSKTKQLKCTSTQTTHTCTSKYAWVCPEGWSACGLSPGVKTCCTKPVN